MTTKEVLKSIKGMKSMLYVRDILLDEANHLNVSVMILMKLLLKKCHVKKIPDNRVFTIKIAVNKEVYFKIYVGTSTIFINYISTDYSELQKLYSFLIGQSFESKQMDYANGWNIFQFGYADDSDFIVNPIGIYKSYKVNKHKDLKLSIWAPTRSNEHRFVWWDNNDSKSDNELLLRYLANTKAGSSYNLFTRMNYMSLFGVGINMIDYFTLLISQSNVEVKYYEYNAF